MDFNSEPLSHDLLLDVLINETNQSHWLRRCIILIFGISFVIFILLLTLTLVFTKTNKQQSSSIKTVSVMMNSTTTTIPMRITSTEIKTTTSKNCFSNSWNLSKDILINSRSINGLAVDSDFNIYTVNRDLQALQKWPPGADKPINLFEGRFQTSPLFYHSLSRSLYFCYVLQDNPGVYKLVDDSSTPVNVINSKGKGSNLDQLGTTYTGLYVNSAGDIFVLDATNDRVVKWTMNAKSGVLVAGGGGRGSGSKQLSSPLGLFVDEINDAIYVVDVTNKRIQKYSNGSANGMTVFGGGPNKIFSDVMTVYMDPLSVIVDKMGNILVGEVFKITKWTPDIKSSVTVTYQDIQGGGFSENGIHTPVIMAFDKLENLYVHDSVYNQVVKFSRKSILCINNLQ